MGKSFYEILGVAGSANPADIQQRYRKLVMENHPDRFKDPQEKAAAEARLKDITEAYNTLSNGKLRMDYDKSILEPKAPQKSPQEKAKEFFTEAMDYYRKGDMKAAQALFAFILKSEPSNASAKFYMGMAKLHSALDRVQGAKDVESALQMDPYHADWFLDYAKKLKEFGQELRAKKVVEEGMKANPADHRLEEFLKTPEKDEGKPASKGGVFSMFGKKP